MKNPSSLSRHSRWRRRGNPSQLRWGGAPGFGGVCGGATRSPPNDDVRWLRWCGWPLSGGVCERWSWRRPGLRQYQSSGGCSRSKLMTSGIPWASVAGGGRRLALLNHGGCRVSASLCGHMGCGLTMSWQISVGYSRGRHLSGGSKVAAAGAAAAA